MMMNGTLRGNRKSHAQEPTQEPVQGEPKSVPLRKPPSMMLAAIAIVGMCAFVASVVVAAIFLAMYL